MPPAVPDELEEDVRELIAAKEQAGSLAPGSWPTISSTDGDSSISAMLAALKLTPDAVDATFADATHFVAVVLSRLKRDPSSLEMRLWEIQTHENRLWALRQQASVGSCDGSRGSKQHALLVHHDETTGSSRGLVRWAPCCARVSGESKLKLWQALGEMRPLEAQLRYILIVSELAPEWANPLSTDSALLRTWTPDDESDRCTICDEVFTFLNRRHHCRRCSNLVCAVCSPHSMPLRVFSQASEKPQRICKTCFHEIDRQRAGSGSTTGVPTTRLNGISIHDPKAANSMGRPPETTYSFEDGNEDETAVEPPPAPLLLASATLATPSVVYRQALASASATIHCGHLEHLHGTGFRKNWHTYFFVLLIRKGSLGMFLTETDHIEKKKRPAAVFKLSGYTIRIKSQKRRPHQFRLAHATKKPLHFAAPNIEDMNLWISQFIKAIDNANDLEAQVTSPSGVASAISMVSERRQNGKEEAETEEKNITFHHCVG